MYFPDYVRILNRNFKKPLGIIELCTILFDSVIVPLDLKGKDNDILTISNTNISHIMNRKAIIPKQIRNNIYEEIVLESIEAYFEENIVLKIRPERADVCLQMLNELKNDKDLSKDHFNELKKMAKPEKMASFLSQLFIYVIVKENKIDDGIVCDDCDSQEYNSILSVKSINNNIISDCLVIETFWNNYNIPSMDEMKRILIDLYECINNLHVDHSISYGSIIGFPLEPKVEYLNDVRDMIKSMSDILSVEMSEDFFDTSGAYRVTNILDPSNEKKFAGEKVAVEKAEKIEELRSKIIKYTLILNHGHILKDIKCLGLVICNEGNTYDEDVRVTVSIPKEDYYSIADFSELGREKLSFLIDDIKFLTYLDINRGINFLDYHESIKDIHSRGIPYRSSYLQSHSETAEEYLEDINNALDYYVGELEESIIIEVKFDKISHNTAVAFPQVILLKDGLSKIEYTIKSARNAKVISGDITNNNIQK